jgi:CheY-like chemotaxis protein
MGLTQSELASISNLERDYVADVERGARNVTLRGIMSLADALQVTVARLLTRESGDEGTAWHIGRVPAPAAAGAILLVEDSPTDAALTMRAFKRAGIANPLSVARDAEEAMEILFGNGRYSSRGPARPQFILLDLNLPGMSGLEFLRRAKGYPSTRHIPVVVLTASRSDQMIRECGRLGAESYIIKPLSVESLVRSTPNLSLRVLQQLPN